jgi:hypothetical protein
MVLMRAKFVDSVAMHRRNLQTFEQCLYIKNNQKVNIVVMIAPPRHYLLPSSCANSEVISYSKQLRRRMKQYNNVKVLETDLERKYFTKHGLHLNSSGKEFHMT